jgi:isoamylase
VSPPDAQSDQLAEREVETAPAVRIQPGHPFPLGANVQEDGVNFAVFSQHGTRAYVCLYDRRDPSREIARHELWERTAHVFHGFVPGLKPGALYGFRVDGPFEPSRGHRFNVNKLLIDPYARAINGEVDWKGPVFGYPLGHEDKDLAFDERDDAAAVPKAVVLSDAYDWGDDRRPDVAWSDTIIYELHVRGFTMRHPGVPEQLRGTYAGLGHPAAIEHLRKLGVTTVELLPVHEAVDDAFLSDKGLRNYWGYSTIGFFAPEQRYGHSRQTGGHVAEFKQMVKAMHAAGLEVILDVVYNHTGEGNQLGPTLSFRGLDNASYYHLSPEDLRYPMEFTGCGNSLNLGSLYTVRFVMDSLRYWATEMHVDGFRFDLCTTLGRTWPDFAYRPWADFFQAVHQDPVLSRLKLIAEPWDTGPDGYQVGNFPILWSEWNGRYRDAVRRFWRGDENQAGEMGYRLTGSADLYHGGGRRQHASINFVTAHDGFTLHDLVTYEHKHNEANGEDNRDGSDDNISANHGIEGETDNPEIISVRERQKRNLLSTLLLSLGVPMLVAGDEMGRTQRGNNNGYCQDNEISWVDWDLDDRRKALLRFTTALIALRRDSGTLRRDHWIRGEHLWDSRLKDLAWFRPDGTEMPADDWQTPFVRSLGYLLGGDALVVPDEHGRRLIGDTLLVLLNAHDGEMTFTLPKIDWGESWETVVDTGQERDPLRVRTPAGGRITLKPRSLAVLRRPAPES